MLIDVYPAEARFQPGHQNFTSPPHNADYGVEQDFYAWLNRNRQLVASSIDLADARYIPVYFNRYYINNDWGQSGLGELQTLLTDACATDKPCFTVCEYDIRDMQPDLVPDNLIVMVASRRKDDPLCIDIPLLCTPHAMLNHLPDKRSKAFFAGNSRDFGVRIEMDEALSGQPGIDLLNSCGVDNGAIGTDQFVERMLATHLALSPRGHGGSSFRFYEAMQLGVVPLHIGDPDVRPFPNSIDWSVCSLYRPDNSGLLDFINGLDSDTLIEMGKTARTIYNRCLAYGAWEDFAMYELELKCQTSRE